jgi:two-component system response regulator YesN
MARAAQLLRQDSMPVNRVARAVGYRQPAQFAKAFRRHHGAPPSAFRSGEAPG